MKLYFPYSLADTNGDRVVVADKKNRIAGYFIWNTNNGNFLNFTTIQGKAQDDLSASEIVRCDYLDCIISVPIFSRTATEVFKERILEDIDFHPISIIAGDAAFDFYVGRCKRYLKVLHMEKSQYRPLTDGSAMLSVPVFGRDFDEEFYIARDRLEPQILVVSTKFVDLCREYKLNIGFLEAQQC